MIINKAGKLEYESLLEEFYYKAIHSEDMPDFVDVPTEYKTQIEQSFSFAIFNASKAIEDFINKQFLTFLKMDTKVKEQPESLAVSDMQLFLAFYMRKGLDFSKHIKQQANNEGKVEYLLEYEPEDNFELVGKGVKLIAKFNADYQNIFIKFINTKNE